MRVGLAVAILISLALVNDAAVLHAQEPQGGRKFNPSDIVVADGYKIEPILMNLSVPTTALFDGNDLIIAESGWVNTAPARILRIKPDWSVNVLASAGLEWPVTGLALKDGQLFVSHKGKVSVVQNDGTLRDVITGLPSNGDHQNNNIVPGPDGKFYLGQGTVTNSAVVGVDSYIFGWLKNHPEAHDVPCKDITLVGQNFESTNPLTEDPNDKATTGAYKPFGQTNQPGEMIKGDVKCNGAILRFNPDGSNLEVVAWGLRNPFGLEFDRNGQLWAAYHGADVRGSRPIFNDPDYLVKVEQGAWYGWPEFFDGKPVTDEQFHDPTKPKPEFLWKEHPPLAKIFTTFPTHAGVNGLAFSPGKNFGFDGDAFVAEFGAFTVVTTGINVNAPGFSIARVDMKTAKVSDFARNVLPGPAYINRQFGFDRPSDVVFGPDDSLYIVDWGASVIGTEGLKLVPVTGSVWRIYKDGAQQALRPNGPLGIVPPPQIPEAQRKPEVSNVPEAYLSYAPVLLLLGGGVIVVLLLIMVIVRIMLGKRRAG